MEEEDGEDEHDGEHHHYERVTVKATHKCNRGSHVSICRDIICQQAHELLLGWNGTYTRSPGESSV